MDTEEELNDEMWEIGPSLFLQITTALHNVILGKTDEVILPMLPIEVYQESLKQLGIEMLPEHQDTNGWQIDFWIDVKHEDNKYILEGSLWYGQFKFYKNDTTE